MRLERLGENVVCEALRHMVWSLVFKLRAVGSHGKVLCREWSHQICASKRSFWLQCGKEAGRSKQHSQEAIAIILG